MDPPTTTSSTPTSLLANIRTGIKHGSMEQTEGKLAQNDNIPVVKKSSSFATKENWNDVIEMIQRNPLLITPHVLGTTLKHNPPIEVIELMLLLQPSVANIPKQGPTALQVAVQHGASCEVVRAILMTCPFALCVTNPQCPEDPLSYAKRHRKNEMELIQLLSRPLSDWIRKDESSTSSRLPLHLTEDESIPVLPVEPVPNDLFSPIAMRNTKNSIVRQEFNNVKMLCAQVLKGHKKLSKQLLECQEQLEKQKFLTKTEDESILQELNKRQKIHFRHQLIALDMKERAFLARVKQAEEECMKQCSEQLLHWKQSMDDWKTQADQQWKEWEMKQSQEMRNNAQFRHSICRWMDTQYHDEFPNENAYHCENEDKNDPNNDASPILFATNLGEVREYVPLRASESSSSSSCSDVAPRNIARRGPLRHDDMRTSTTATTTTFRRPFSRRQAWKAQVRKLDCTANFR